MSTHILSDATNDKLIAWAKGPQVTAPPSALSLCRQMDATPDCFGPSILAPLWQTWKSVSQWRKGCKGSATCPTCARIASNL